jgi:class 3 adenylate cyclase/predicted ATPase
MDIAAWLRGLGLEQYAPAFRDNDVDGEVLPELTADDLISIGVTSVGHRRKLLAAIAALGAEPTRDLAQPAESVTSTPISPLTSDAERRQLTVMFCDLVGSTVLSSRLDPEDLREVIAAYHRAVAEVVTEFDGFIAKYMGDGVLVYFGYPRAHEDDAERAVRAGLGVIDAVGCLDIKSVKLQARVGIATGLVVVGDLIGEGSAQEQSVVGETPNLAARLQSLAEPGALLVDANTRRLIGELFEFHDLGAVEAKGFAGAVPAWQVLRQSRVASRFEALRASSLTPLVGREEEIEFLLRRWARAKEGHGQVVLVSGEPGIGKSRITAALADGLRDEPSLRLRYFCTPYYENSPLYPVIAQLERAAGFVREDPPATKLEKLGTLLAQSAASSEETALIGELLALPLPDSGAAVYLTPQRKKEKTLEALVRQVEALARGRPVLMVFEDAHWIDPTSRELLDLTIARLRSLRVLLVITFRPEFEPPWTGQAHVGLLALNRLDAQDGTALAERVAGKALPPAVVAQITARADGIPLFVEELTRALIENGSLRDQGSRYELDQPLPLLAVPLSLHASLLARLDRLAPAREIAQIGAAIGREFSYELLAAVAGRGDDEVRHALDQLAEAGLVFQRGVPPHATYLFKHALVQDAAYGTLLRGPRQALHGRIAAALEQRFSDSPDTPAELLAQHWGYAGSADKAILYWLKAAEKSIDRSAMAEARVQIEKGLELLSAIPKEADRHRYELGLQVALWRVLMTAKGPATEETGRALQRAREICEALGEIKGLAQIMYGQWSFYAHAGDLTTAQRRAEDLLAFGIERRDPAATAVGNWALGWNSFVQGRGSAALSYFDNSTHGATTPDATVAILGFDAGATAAAYSGLVHFCLGHIDKAAAQSEAAVLMARGLSHPETEAVVGAVLCRYLWLARNCPALKQHSEAFAAVMAAHGFAYWRAQSDVYRGWHWVEGGSTEKGLALLSESLAAHRASGTSRWFPLMLAVYAAACQRANELEQALGALAEAAQVTEQSGERWFEPELERLRGEILLAAGSANEAEPHFTKAITIARNQSAKTWELRAATSLARLWRDHGKRQQACDLLAPVYGWFTEGFDTADLKETKALLDELA